MSVGRALGLSPILFLLFVWFHIVSNNSPIFVAGVMINGVKPTGVLTK